MPTISPLYQLTAAPGATWRVRVFNLPAYQEGVPPTLPFLRALAARTRPWHSGWHKDAEDKLTVLRLAGTERAALDALLALLDGHGITRPSELGPAAKRLIRAAS